MDCIAFPAFDVDIGDIWADVGNSVTMSTIFQEGENVGKLFSMKRRRDPIYIIYIGWNIATP